MLSRLTMWQWSFKFEDRVISRLATSNLHICISHKVVYFPGIYVAVLRKRNVLAAENASENDL